MTNTQRIREIEMTANSLRRLLDGRMILTNAHEAIEEISKMERKALQLRSLQS